jgi:hypothetical protein
MNIEHSDCLSWFSRGCESHKQDGETLPAQLCCNACSASRDPAMAFGSSLDMNGQWPVPQIGSNAAGQKRTHHARRQQTRGISRAQTF